MIWGMSLARTADIVAEAARTHIGAGAFNMITVEHGEAIVAGAERAQSPVIIQISENAVAFHGGGLRPLAAAAGELAAAADVAVALHLDHVTDESMLRGATQTSISSVMFDAGALPYAANVERTRAAVQWAHANDLWLEAELGYVGGKPDAPTPAHAPGTRTDPAEARAFVAATGVDALAVAVGSSHAMTAREASVDDVLVARIAAQVSVPLVLHGSSGVPDEHLVSAIRAGIVKVNVGTALNVAMTAAVRRKLAQDADLVDPRKYLAPARDAMAEAVANLLAVIRQP
jgi:fructose-bisphosphate aldolase, class II